MAQRTCSIEGCERPHIARGWCATHYSRRRRGQDLTASVRIRGRVGCEVDGCDRRHAENGLCGTHASRWRDGRDLTAPVRVVAPGRGCSVDGCTRPHAALGLCRTHHERQLKGRDLTAPMLSRGVPAYLRVLARCHVTDDGCWIATSSLDKEGYGRVSIGGDRGALAHRVVYEALIGPIPEGHDLDHTCRQHACVNPTHTQPVTRAENMRRSRLAPEEHRALAEKVA